MDFSGMRFMAVLVVLVVWAVPASRGEDTKPDLSEKGLVGYWPMDGRLTEAKSKAEPTAVGGEAAFTGGPLDGKAVLLKDGRFLTAPATGKLDTPAATVTLMFQVASVAGKGNPCLVAKRSGKGVRYSIHVMSDLKRMAMWNGKSVGFCDVPGGLATGRWYHLTAVMTAGKTVFYIDGIECDGAGPGLVPGAKNLPLQIGSSTPEGMEIFNGAITRVAIYDRAFSPEEVVKKVDAAGWGERRKKLALAAKRRREEAQRRAAERARTREERIAKLMDDPALLARGKGRVYSGENLTAISLPVGGIGAGCIQINGKAERHIWQIHNNFTGVVIPHSFFAVRAKAGGEPIVRAMQTSAVGPFAPMESLTFRGEYPFAWYDFQDDKLPVAVSMEAFSPLTPLNARDSAIPCAVFNLTAANTSDKPVDVTFVAAQQNAVGFVDKAVVKGRSAKCYGGNANKVMREKGMTVLHMTSSKSKDSARTGDMALAAIAEKATAAASWDSLDALLEDISKDGALGDSEKAGPSAAGQTLDGALAVSFTLKPGEKRTVTFVLTWYFPRAGHGGWKSWKHTGNMYTNWWSGAPDVARYVNENLDRLTSRTRLYHDTFYASNLPHWLLDRITSQVAILRSKTCFWAKDGYFGAWEGTSRGGGCCPGNCTHVWHYAQAHARLFPSIARRMRKQIYECQQASGALPHRLSGGMGPAADGHCGDILGAYREYLCSKDRKWLDGMWPSVKKAMEFAVSTWDKDQDGVLAGAQWNTLDGNLGGSTSWIGSLYLAALEASARMADLQGDADAAKRYRRIRASGATKQDETLFNGEYYRQIRDPKPYHDYGNGCAIDQVLGEWWANQVGIPPVYPADHVRSAMKSLLKYNFRTDFHGIPQKPRKFVHNDDAGLQMIQWPKGKRPNPTIRYGDEVMTGFEYPATATMVQYGMLKEGFMVTKAIYDRYDGRLRTGLTPSNTASWGYSGNPFGDDECGKFYARAMSVWSMLLVCQGFIYDGPAGEIGFKPVWKPDDHKSFFTGAEGYGLFTQKRDGAKQYEKIKLAYGKLRVGKLIFAADDKAKPSAVKVTAAGKAAKAKFTFEKGLITISLDKPATIEAGQSIDVEITR